MSLGNGPGRPGQTFTGWIDNLNEGLDALMYTMHQVEGIYKKAERLSPAFKEMADTWQRVQSAMRSDTQQPPSKSRRASAGIRYHRRKKKRKLDD